MSAEHLGVKFWQSHNLISSGNPSRSAGKEGLTDGKTPPLTLLYRCNQKNYTFRDFLSRASSKGLNAK